MISRVQPCACCGGSGTSVRMFGSARDLHLCEYCGGSGRVTVAVRTPGEVEDLAALTARAESAERERDSARAEVERLRATRSGGEALAAMQIERDELRAALREAVEIVEVAPPLTGDSVRDLAEYRRRFEIRARARAALKGET